jgi:fumarate reductase flavoprotein subunit
MKYSFETPPASIPESDIREVVETDIVVVGAGPAGLAAAASAAEQGAKVVLLEAFHSISAPGGPGAPFVESTMQKEREARKSSGDSAPSGMPPTPPGFTPPAMPGLPGAPGAPLPGLKMPGHGENSPNPTKEEMIEGLWKGSACRADERLIKLWADRSGEVADWLCQMADEQGIDVMLGRFSHMFCKPGCSPFSLNRTPVGAHRTTTSSAYST